MSFLGVRGVFVSTPTILIEFLPRVFRLAEVAAKQEPVTDDDAVGLQRRAPAHQHRGRVQRVQLQLLWRCGWSCGGGNGGGGRRRVSNYSPETRPGSCRIIRSCWVSWRVVWRPSAPVCLRHLGAWTGRLGWVQVMAVAGWLVLMVSLKASCYPGGWRTELLATVSNAAILFLLFCFHSYYYSYDYGRLPSMPTAPSPPTSQTMDICQPAHWPTAVRACTRMHNNAFGRPAPAVQQGARRVTSGFLKTTLV